MNPGDRESIPIGERNCEAGFGRSCGPATVGVWEAGPRLAAFCHVHAPPCDALCGHSATLPDGEVIECLLPRDHPDLPDLHDSDPPFSDEEVPK